MLNQHIWQSPAQTNFVENYNISNSPISHFLLHLRSSACQHKNIGEGKTDPRVEFSLPKYHNQDSTSWLCKYHFQRQNVDQTPAQKSCLNFNFKTLTKPCVQSLNQSLALLPSLSSQICNKLLPTRSSSSTSATVTTSTIFELASSQKALYNFKKLYSKRYGVNYFSSSTSITVTTSIKFPKRQSVSELVTSIANDRTRVR